MKEPSFLGDGEQDMGKSVIDVERFARMVMIQQGMIDDGEWTHGPVTLLEVLDLHHSEVHHCRVLRWLFDPMAHHGLGVAFIRAFSSHLGLEMPNPQRARADAEVPRRRSRADVVVQEAGGLWIVVIEAKLSAAEGDRQAARLELDWRKPAILVFLTRQGRSVPLTAGNPHRWRPLSWTWVIDTARALLLAQPPNGAKNEASAREAVATWVSGAERSIR